MAIVARSHGNAWTRSPAGGSARPRASRRSRSSADMAHAARGARARSADAEYAARAGRRCSREFRRRVRKRYPPDDCAREAWHDAHGREVLHRDPRRSRRCCPACRWRGRGAIVNIVGSGGKVASPVHIPGGAANAALMLATAGARRGAPAAAGRPHQRDQSRRDADRSRAGSDSTPQSARSTGLDPEELLARMKARIPLGAVGDAGGGGAGGGVPRFGCCESMPRRRNSHGWCVRTPWRP